MNLEEIEAKADEYAAALIETPNAGMVKHYRDKLIGLNHAVQIHGVRDRRAEWNVSVGWREAEIDAMHKAANAAEAAVAQRTPREQAYPVSFNADPVKPVADRLHELVSYLVRQSETDHHAAQATQLGATLEARYQASSKAYDDAATKLQEILQEGGI